MPLINPPDVVPEAMRFLLRALLAHKSAECDRDELLALVAPSGLGASLKAVDKNEAADPSGEAKGGQIVAQASLTALVSLGFAGTRDGRVFAADPVTRDLKTAEALTASRFARMVRTRIFQSEPSGGRGPAHDLVSAVALSFATEEPLTPLVFEGDQGRRFDMIQQERHGSDQSRWAVGNSTQWPAARRWAIYLGLGRPIPVRKTTGLIVEASRALREDLDVPIDTYQIGTFLRHCAEVLPFADGGSETLWTEQGEPEVSPGMSLTLRQLEALGDLFLESRSDTAGKIIALGTRPDLRENITHVSWRRSDSSEGVSR